MKGNNQLKNFVGIRQIADNFVFLDDNTLVAVLEILPIEFDKFQKSRQDKIVKNYNDWIRNLDYPVQIIVRNTNVDLDKQVNLILENVDREIKKRDDMREMLKLFDNFKDWLLNYIAKEKKIYRTYYLILPLIDFRSQSLIKRPFSYKKGKEELLERKKELLNNRVMENIQALQKTGVKAYRLNDSQLENLFSSYFQVNSHKGHGEESLYSDPSRWFEMWKQSKKE